MVTTSSAPSDLTVSSEYPPTQTEIEIIDSQSQSWISMISETVYANPAVEALFVSRGEEAVRDYWVVIPERDIALVRELISEQQNKVLRLFAHTDAPFQLDFHIVYRNERDINELIPSEAISIPKP
ncbi:MAG: hypothetical protein BZY79_06675 [SAR202 cluster bacterium Casp-Chloro-G4]|nr:MAG: hypothetical protein BZY79_06675 [SAR202 cluster bacterium Casp-Chloro-G4]